MATTVIDPTDGSTYDIVPAGRYWDIRQAVTGDRPEGLEDKGPWPSMDQALAALRELCQRKQREAQTAGRPTVAGRR